MSLHGGELAAVLSWLHTKIWAASADAVFAVFKSDTFYIGIAAVLLLEKLFPAKPLQKKLSLALFQDFVWLLIQTVFQVAVIAFYISFLSGIYTRHFDFLTIRGISGLSPWVKLPLWFLAADFLAWSHHWLRHRVPWFWQFHVLHHSQRELNLFTDYRYHLIEYVISKTVTVFPLMVLGENLNSILYYALVHDWYRRIYHANIRSDFGILRYLLVTPQSHRIHHSIEKRHYDKNFGVILSVWDYIFRTRYDGWNEYPDTGVPDENFPLEKNAGGFSLLMNPIRQHLYPFKVIARDLARRKL